MKAVTRHGRRDIRADSVPDPDEVTAFVEGKSATHRGPPAEAPAAYQP
ncbi:hypothetical protein ABT093_28795 [Kitasatospora sp. NPDC002551]